MDSEVMELEDEIKVLKARVSELEKSNNRRRAYGYIKLLVKICMIGLIIYGIWQGYDYATREVPNLIEDKIKEINPFKSKKTT